MVDYWNAPREPSECYPGVVKPELITRLVRLWHKLEDEGRYTDANTVALAIESLCPTNQEQP